MSSTTNPYAPPRAAVRDIADPNALNEPAERATRLFAAILDGIIFAVMVYVPLFGSAILGAIAGGAASEVDPDAGSALFGVGMLIGCVGFVAWAWLTIKYVNANGQSIAKKMLGIKVIRINGEPATLGRIFWLRNVLNTVISIIPLYSIIDVLFIFSESRQTLHDKLADTTVIKA
jgi:uncharacterized RDD family membrane protein YckC